MARLVSAEDKSDHVPGRLYGLVGAERLHDDPATVFDSEIEDQFDPMPERIEIEEWSVTPQRNHLPAADTLLEWVAEWTVENALVDEVWSDHIYDGVALPDVVAATEALLDLLASKNQYRMADKHLRSLWVTFDEGGEPLLDGEPMFSSAGVTRTDDNGGSTS